MVEPGAPRVIVARAVLQFAGTQRRTEVDIETEKQWQRPLTDVEMAKVVESIGLAESAGDALVAAMVGVFDIALHDEGSSWEECTSITPWHYAIPESQWHRIGEALLARQDRTDMGRGN